MKEYKHKGEDSQRNKAPDTSSISSKVESAAKGFGGGCSYEHDSNGNGGSKVSGLNFKEGGDGYLVNSPNASPKGKMGYSN